MFSEMGYLELKVFIFLAIKTRQAGHGGSWFSILSAEKSGKDGAPQVIDLFKGEPPAAEKLWTLPKTRSSHKTAMNGAQLLMTHGDSSGLMSGPPALASRSQQMPAAANK